MYNHFVYNQQHEVKKIKETTYPDMSLKYIEFHLAVTTAWCLYVKVVLQDFLLYLYHNYYQSTSHDDCLECLESLLAHSFN